ncbi:MAG: glycoside hydrolase family 88 protein [Caldilineaceae bacterium]|nr:glycoside hydrolase family 88 protein [Caldilineaceae bacterium]MDE0340116.1 glycoside hydrolase family 88 protein [Caldilineaceae bacterium]
MSLDQQIEDLLAQAPGFWHLDACGVTRSERQIPALLHGVDQPPAGERLQLVLIGGLSGKQEDADAALAALHSYRTAPGLSARYALSAAPCANPDGLALGAAPENGAGGNPGTAYPPPGDSYYDANPEAHYLWRWVSFQAPDLVLEIRTGDSTTWEGSALCLELLEQLGSVLNASELPSDSSLLGALSTGEPNLLPSVFGLRLTCAAADLDAELNKLWTVLAQVPDHARSPTRSALQARAARSPLEAARILAGVYGHELDPVIYTQGVAVSGRLRLAQLDTEYADPSDGIADMVAPYMSGAKEWFPAGGDGGANLAGLVWADELAATTGDNRYADLLVQTADRYRATHDNGVPIPSNPNYQVEDMFFTAAVLGRAFKLTGDDAYLSILTRFLLDANVQQADGLFWHDRRTPFYWGRGNGFAALSYAETLTYMPDDHPDRAAMLAIHRRHLQALRGYQHRSGMWRQVVNGPGSYPEMTVTCMVGYALARGLRRGWLDAGYTEMLTRAWQGVAARIDDHGGLVDVCTGTGVQQSTRDYLDRPAIFGPDERGGALSLWFVTEMASFLQEN